MAVLTPAAAALTYPRSGMTWANRVRRGAASHCSTHCGGRDPRAYTALAELHALLLRGAYHELRRRPEVLARLSPADFDDLAHQAKTTR